MDNQIDTIMGHHAALAAIENSKRIIISLKCTKEFFEKNRFIIENRKINKLFIVSRKEIDTEIKNNVHQGILLKCKSLKQISLEEINKDEKNIVILDSLNDSQNVGSILRTSYLFGIKTIISNKEDLTKQVEIIESLIMNEVNIKEIKLEKNIDTWIDYEIKPNYETLGPSLGKDISKVAKYLGELTNDQKKILLESKQQM